MNHYFNLPVSTKIKLFISPIFLCPEFFLQEKWEKMHHHRPSATLTLKCPDPESIKEEEVSESESDSEEDDGFREKVAVNQLKKQRLDLDGGSGSKMVSAASGGGRGGGVVVPPQPLPFVCKVNKCGADLSGCKQYHKKHRICEYHSKAQVALVDGLKQRFCQQCSRFHELKEFDDKKRSCRRRLQGHNARRRKTSMAAELGTKKDECGIDQERAGLGPKKDDCRIDQERGRIVMDYPPNHQKIQIL